MPGLPGNRQAEESGKAERPDARVLCFQRTPYHFRADINTERGLQQR